MQDNNFEENTNGINYYVPSENWGNYSSLEYTKYRPFYYRAMLTTNETGWATCCVDYDVQVPEGTKAYAVESVADGTATLKELNTVPAGKGFIFNGAEGTFKLEKAEETPDAITNYLEGTLKETTVKSSSVYTLGKIDDSTVGLLTFTGTTIPAYKAYLPKGANAKQALALSFGDTNLINLPSAQTANAPMYNLQGQRISKPQAGQIYIQNGKKHIMNK